MNALARQSLAPSLPHEAGERERVAYRFAYARLQEQRSGAGVRSAARALGLLLARSVERPSEPVVISALEGAHACGFEPRTWWHVKRRLLELGHLVASTGGGPPSGRPGGRGHKGTYFVAPATQARFAAHLAEQKSLNGSKETVNFGPETVKSPRETVKPVKAEPPFSQHRLRLLENKRTSDVSSLEEDEETPTAATIWAAVRSEPNARVKLKLLRILETVLLAEVLERAMASRAPDAGVLPASVKTSAQTVNEGASRGAKERRCPRAEKPLWSPASSEEQAVFARIQEILTCANQSFGAKFDVERSSKDALLYPFERVRGAVANVLLKRARGYRFTNPGAVLWDGMTLEGYKLEEFSAGPFSEVIERIERNPPPTASPSRRTPEQRHASRPISHEVERDRGLYLQSVYEKLPNDTRKAIDDRAFALAREELGGAGSTLRLGLLRLDKRNELLLAEYAEAEGWEERGPNPKIRGSRQAETKTEPIERESIRG